MPPPPYSEKEIYFIQKTYNLNKIDRLKPGMILAISEKLAFLI